MEENSFLAPHPPSKNPIEFHTFLLIVWSHRPLPPPKVFLSMEGVWIFCETASNVKNRIN